MSEADRERWADDHWDYVERIGAEDDPRETDGFKDNQWDPTEDDYDPMPPDYFDCPPEGCGNEVSSETIDTIDCHILDAEAQAAYDQGDVFERYFTNRYGRL